MRMIRAIVGLTTAAGALALGWWGWTAWGPMFDGLRRFLGFLQNDVTLLTQIVAAILLACLADWLWRVVIEPLLGGHPPT